TRKSRCCWRWRTVRSTPTRPSRPAATCRASSAAQSRPSRMPAIRSPRRWVRSARALARRSPASPVPVKARSSASLAAIQSPLFRWELAKMKTVSTMRRARLGTAMAALALALGTVGTAAPAVAQPTAAKPAETVNLSKGTGTLVRLSEPMSDVFVANDAIADVQVRSPMQLYVFGKGTGETTIYATAKSGRVVYAANVRVGNNISSVGEMLHLAMPDASIQATPMNNLVLLTGTVANPDDVAEAQRLTQAYVGTDTQVVTHLKSATPLQVMLKVRIAEVNRSVLKSMGVNLLSQDTTGGFLFGIGRGNPGTISNGTATFNISGTGTTLGAAGHLLGLNLLGTLDIAANDGLANMLAEP